MDTNEFMGLLIGCLVTLLGIASVIVAIIVKPVINLNRSITKLNSTIDSLSEKNTSLNERVDRNREEIDILNLHQISQDKDLENHEKRLTKLENNVGGRNC